jgi:LPXTG-motif cell wall-anchored protein
MADDNALATYAAVLGLSGAALPVRTANVAGAQAAVAPAAALPATGAAEAPLALPAMVAAALALGGAGLLLRRRALRQA